MLWQMRLVSVVQLSTKPVGHSSLSPFKGNGKGIIIMTLAELGQVYLDNAELVQQQIRHLRPNLKIYQGIALIELRMQLSRLYEMHSDMVVTGNQLLRYYEA